MEEAESALQHCLSMDADNMQAHALLAEVLLAEGKSELAVRETNHAIRLAQRSEKTK